MSITAIQLIKFLFLVGVIFCALVYIMGEPDREATLSELEIKNAIYRLKVDIKECRTKEQLSRLCKFRDKILDDARKYTNKYDYFNRELLHAFIAKSVELSNEVESYEFSIG